MDRIQIKEASKKIIEGNLKWKILVVLIINALIVAIPSIIGGVSTNSKVLEIIFGIVSIIAAIALVPLNAGLALYMLNIVRNGEDQIELMFDKFKDFVQILLCDIITGIQIFLGSIIIVPGIIWTFKYSQINYIFADNPGISWSDARKQSAQLMDGNKWDLFVFSLSFIGWELLVLITFGIAAIYVGPYMQTAYTVYYENLKEKYNDKISVNPMP